MTRIKKIITTTFLVLVLLASSLLLMACGKSVTATGSYTLLNSIITIYKDQSEMFGEGTANGVLTKFYLQDFKSKNSDGQLVLDSENYLTFVALGMNFIEENVEALNGLEVKYNYKGFNNQVLEMNDAYNALFQEFANLKTLDADANYNIYNGYFARYREYTKDFIDEIYDVAIELGSFLVQTNGDGIGSSDATSDYFNTYIDYNKLLISRDYKNFFINSASGKTFEEGIVNDAQNNFNNYCLNLFKNTNISLANEKAQNVKELLNAVETDRANVTKSLEEFSVYDFYTTYECSLTAYEKNIEDATIYYANIENYFANNGLLAKLYDYMLAL